MAETALLLTSVAAASSVRPWRLLGRDSRYDLLLPLIATFLCISLLWWWPGTRLSPLFGLVGANLALLMLGWPLAMLTFCVSGAFGLLIGYGWSEVVDGIVWQGLLPASLALGLGYGARRLAGNHPATYLFGRGFCIPLATTCTVGLAAAGFFERFSGLGSFAPAAVFLTCVIDAMLTVGVVCLLVVHKPAFLATWSDDLYLPKQVGGSRLHRLGLE